MATVKTSYKVYLKEIKNLIVRETVSSNTDKQFVITILDPEIKNAYIDLIVVYDLSKVNLRKDNTKVKVKLNYVDNLLDVLNKNSTRMKEIFIYLESLRDGIPDLEHCAFERDFITPNLSDELKNLSVTLIYLSNHVRHCSPVRDVVAEELKDFVEDIRTTFNRVVAVVAARKPSALSEVCHHIEAKQSFDNAAYSLKRLGEGSRLASQPFDAPVITGNKFYKSWQQKLYRWSKKVEKGN